MARTNCIVTDRGYNFSLDSKTIDSPDGTLIANLCNIDISKFTKQELIELTILFQKTYEKGQSMATDNFRTKIQNFFDFKY